MADFIVDLVGSIIEAVIDFVIAGRDGDERRKKDGR